MIELLFATGLRIIATLLPAVFVFFIASRESTQFANDALYLYTMMSLVSLLARGGCEVFIAQAYSTKFYVNRIWLSFAQILFRTNLASIILSSIIGVTFLDLESMNDIFLFAICTMLLTSNWICLNFLQARGLTSTGLFLSQFLFYSLVLFKCGSSNDIDIESLLTIFVESLLCVICLMLIFIIRAFQSQSPPSKYSSSFVFTPSLWFSNISGRGKTLILQSFFGIMLAPEVFVELMVLLRFLEVPLAALVGTGFVAKTYLNHRKDWRTEQKKYIRLCKLSVTLALLSSIFIPIYSHYFPQIVEPQNLYTAWMMGVVLTAFGPIAIVLNTLERSNDVASTRLYGILLLTALMGIGSISGLVNTATALDVTLICFFCEILERVVLGYRFNHHAQRFG